MKQQENKNKNNDKNIEQEINNYFNQAKSLRCPKSMKQNLYAEIGLHKKSWFVPKLAIAGLTLVFVTSVLFKISTNTDIKVNTLNNEQTLDEAQLDLKIAMHYINRVSFKTLSAVNNDGIKPAIIKPLAKSQILL